MSLSAVQFLNFLEMCAEQELAVVENGEGRVVDKALMDYVFGKR